MSFPVRKGVRTNLINFVDQIFLEKWYLSKARKSLL